MNWIGGENGWKHIFMRKKKPEYKWKWIRKLVHRTRLSLECLLWAMPQCASAFGGCGRWPYYMFATVSLFLSLSLLHFGRKFSHNHNSNINRSVCGLYALHESYLIQQNFILYARSENGSRQMWKRTLAMEHIVRRWTRYTWHPVTDAERVSLVNVSSSVIFHCEHAIWINKYFLWSSKYVIRI